MKKTKFIGVRFLLFGVAWVGVMGLLVLFLWNHLAPPIFHLREITYFEGLGLLILCRVLFGGFRGWGSGIRRARYVRGLKNLTAEEREHFRRAMSGRGDFDSRFR